MILKLKFCVAVFEIILNNIKIMQQTYVLNRFKIHSADFKLICIFTFVYKIEVFCYLQKFF